MDTGGVHLPHDQIVQIVIECPQHFIFAQNLNHLAAQSVQYAGKFRRDIACPGDSHPARLVLQFEKAVAGDNQFRPGEVGFYGAPTGCNQNMPGLISGTVGLNGAGAGETAVSDYLLYPVVVQIAVINVVQAGNVGIPRLLDGLPVEAPGLQVKSITFGMAENFRDPRCVPHHFLGYTPDVDAGPPHPAIFDQCHPGAVFGSPPGRGDSAAATADHKIVVLLRHFFCSGLFWNIQCTAYPLRRIYGPPLQTSFSLKTFHL